MADVQESEDAMGDEVYQPQGPGDSEVLDDVGILDSEDTLLNRGVDPYDEGWSPPERPLGVDHTGVTAREQREGETLDERLAEEVPEDWDRAYEGDGVGDAADTDGELLDDEVGDHRAGRLVAPDEGARPDEEKDLLARDEGFAGGAASAEEAAVHVVPDDDYY